MHADLSNAQAHLQCGLMMAEGAYPCGNGIVAASRGGLRGELHSRALLKAAAATGGRSGADCGRASRWPGDDRRFLLPGAVLLSLAAEMGRTA
jgi:hypothetical protein